MDESTENLRIILSRLVSAEDLHEETGYLAGQLRDAIRQVIREEVRPSALRLGPHDTSKVGS